MNKLHVSFSALLGVLCLISAVQADGGNSLVHAEMLANVTAIQPGRAFWAGIKFTIAPGYHIYWKNPGDSGLATEVKFKLPEGFTAGELMFPVPDRLVSPGDIVNYAYEKQLMLLVQITPPKNLPTGKSVTLSAKANWLVCKEDCTPGRTGLWFEMPVADTAAPANQELFKSWGSRLPVKQDLADVASWAGSSAQQHDTIKVQWKNVPTDVQFIPGPTKNGTVENIKVDTVANTSTITFDVKNILENEAVGGLVTFTSPSEGKVGLDVLIPGVILTPG